MQSTNKKTHPNEQTSETPDHTPHKVPGDLPPLVVILGPTAVGKTGFAIQLAGRMNGEIVSADSRLLYRGMDIGTAKPSLEQRKQVPHHLIDVAGPDQTWSLTLFKQKAQEIIRDIQARNQMPFLVGGTGQYIRAIVEDWQIPEVKPDFRLRYALENWAAEIGKDGLHTRLSILDPVSARRINPRNLRRTIRALEVIFHSGKKFSAQSQKGSPIYQLVQIGLILPRKEIFDRIDLRIDQMFADGFVSEVQSLLSEGYPPDLAAFSAIGYSEVIDYLQGKTTLDEAIILIRRRTRLLVRRQANWFKQDDPDIYWFNAEDVPMLEIESLLRCKLQLD